MFIDFREREEEREGGERVIGRERERSIVCLPYAPQLGIEPTTFWCTGRRSNQQNHSARAMISSLIISTMLNSGYTVGVQQIINNKNCILWVYMQQFFKCSKDFTGISSFNSQKDNCSHFIEEEPRHKEFKTLLRVAQLVSGVSEIQMQGLGSPALTTRHCQMQTN